jgi:hypothetical protein
MEWRPFRNLFEQSDILARCMRGKPPLLVWDLVASRQCSQFSAFATEKICNVKDGGRRYKTRLGQVAMASRASFALSHRFLQAKLNLF